MHVAVHHSHAAPNGTSTLSVGPPALTQAIARTRSARRSFWHGYSNMSSKRAALTAQCCMGGPQRGVLLVLAFAQCACCWQRVHRQRGSITHVWHMLAAHSMASAGRDLRMGRAAQPEAADASVAGHVQPAPRPANEGARRASSTSKKGSASQVRRMPRTCWLIAALPMTLGL